MEFPPPQPKEKGSGTQETTYYSDKFSNFPVVIYYKPSKAPTVEKAQQEPQEP